MSTLSHTGSVSASKVALRNENVNKSQAHSKKASIDTSEKINISRDASDDSEGDSPLASAIANNYRDKGNVKKSAENTSKDVDKASFIDDVKEKIEQGVGFIKDGAGFVKDKVAEGAKAVQEGVTSIASIPGEIVDKISDSYDDFSGKEQVNNPGSVDDIRDSETVEKLEANPEYVSILDKRHDNADQDTKALYDKYEKYIKIADLDTTETARYSRGAGQNITVNATEDSKDRPSAGTTYYHEIGHLIDDRMKVGTGYASENKEYSNALKNDFNNYVDNYMKENGISDRDQAYAAIGKMMNGSDRDEYRGVSDLYGGLSDNKAKGGWGHSQEYWNSNPQALNREAFANMFEVSMGGNENSLKYMKEMFPTAYEEFQKMVKNDL